MSKRGFSLIEVLVAMAVGSVLILVVFSVVSEGAAGVSRVTHSSAVRIEAREGLTQLARDLVGFQVGGTRLDSVDAGEWRKDRFEFLARFPKDAQDEDEALSSLCQVVYEVRFDSEGGSSGEPLRQNLYRKIVSSKGVVEKLLDVGGLVSDSDPEKNSGPVAFGVVHFQVELLKISAEGLSAWRPGDEEVPVVGEITLILANDEIASRMKTEQDWSQIGLPSGGVQQIKDNAMKGLSFYQIKVDLRS